MNTQDIIKAGVNFQSFIKYMLDNNLINTNTKYLDINFKGYQQAIDAFEKGNNVILCMPDLTAANYVIADYIVWRKLFRGDKVQKSAFIATQIYLTGMLNNVEDILDGDKGIKFVCNSCTALYAKDLDKKSHTFVVCRPSELPDYLNVVSTLPKKDINNPYEFSLIVNSPKSMHLGDDWFKDMVEKYGIEKVYSEL